MTFAVRGLIIYVHEFDNPMAKKPYTKKAKTKTIKIFGTIKQSIHFPPDTTLEQGLEVLQDSSESVTAPVPVTPRVAL